MVTSAIGDYSPPTTYLPQEGSYFLAIEAGNADVWQEVSQTISLYQYDKISGWAAFDWRDYDDPLFSYVDGAKVELYDSAMNLVATLFSADGSGLPDYWDGSWLQWSYTATTAGNYTLVYAVRNTVDNALASRGYFDALTYTPYSPPPPPPAPIPEPATLSLLGLGLLGLARLRGVAGGRS